MMVNGHLRGKHGHRQTRVLSRCVTPQFVQPKTRSYSENAGFILAWIINTILNILSKFCPEWIKSWLHWCPTSPQLLEIVEQNVLSNLKRPYLGQFINIGKCVGDEDNFIWTISMNQNAEKTPVVLLHGFGCGVGLWIMNLDSLSSSRPVYAIDLLGFGRSSRPMFSSDALECDMQFFISLERWRSAVGLEKFILIGHNLGGYVASSYSYHYPERVAFLILLDPWGLPEKPIYFSHQYKLDWHILFFNAFLHGFNYLSIVRFVGLAGPQLVKMFRSDLVTRYGHFLENSECITDYIYHCNAQIPSGEVAFKAMADQSGWAKYPMMHRLNCLDWKIPITFIYGSRSWGNRQTGLQIKYSRLNSFVDVQVIEGAGHHMYADKPEQFNSLISRICESLENGLIRPNNL